MNPIERYRANVPIDDLNGPPQRRPRINWREVGEFLAGGLVALLIFALAILAMIAL